MINIKKNKKMFNKIFYQFLIILLSIIICINESISSDSPKEKLLNENKNENKDKKHETEIFNNKEITNQEKEEIINMLKDHLKKQLGEEKYNKFIQKNKLDESTITINKKIEKKKIENIPNNNNNENNNKNNNNENFKFLNQKIENEKMKNLNDFYNIEKIINFENEFKIFYFKYKPNNKVKIGIQKNNYLYFNNNLYSVSFYNDNLFFSLITIDKEGEKPFDKNLIQIKKELINQMDIFTGYEIIKKINSNNNNNDNYDNLYDKLKINYTFHFPNQNLSNKNNQNQILILILNVNCPFSVKKFLGIKETLLEITNTSNNNSIRDIYIYTLETSTNIKYYNNINNKHDKSIYLMQCINKNNKGEKTSYDKKVKLLIEYFNNKKIENNNINDCDNIEEIQNKYVENALFYSLMDINKVPIVFLYDIKEKKIKKYTNM